MRVDEPIATLPADTDNTYGLHGLGRLSEMVDAVLGLVCKEMGAGLSLEQQRNLAGDIYKACIDGIPSA